ncbi:MAG: hypothetical protein KAJ73_05445 [Zetaproteobacteria bacterium]|nr:hypothetical protein [Zetaproteobacteria bacterium]
MGVEYRSGTGHNTWLETAESSWSTAWDLPDDVNLIMCMVTNFYAYTEYAPTYDSVAFDLLATSDSNNARQRLYALWAPPTDSDYTISITWTASFKYWCARFVAFSGAKMDGISSISKVESTDWNGTQVSKPGDMVALWAVNRATGNPTLAWDSPGTNRFNIRNDSDGNGEMQSGMATYPGLASTPIGALSGGDGIHTHIMYNNIEQEAGGSKMILVMSEIYDRIRKNRKEIGVGDIGGFGLSGNLWKPETGLVTI